MRCISRQSCIISLLHLTWDDTLSVVQRRRQPIYYKKDKGKLSGSVGFIQGRLNQQLVIRRLDQSQVFPLPPKTLIKSSTSLPNIPYLDVVTVIWLVRRPITQGKGRKCVKYSVLHPRATKQANTPCQPIRDISWSIIHLNCWCLFYIFLSCKFM